MFGGTMFRNGWRLASLVVLTALSSVAWAESSERPVESLDVSPEGGYVVTFMYWCPIGLFPHQFYQLPEFVILGEVVEVEPPSSDMRRSELASLLRGPTAAGRIRVERVLRCPPRLLAEASRIEFLVSHALAGLDVGDRLLVFMIP